ncbi:MAG: hypothetical protein R3E87_19575 [Burkholderiaceae bacterium]
MPHLLTAPRLFALLLCLFAPWSRAEPVAVQSHGMVLAAPAPDALPCTEADFGAVQIRIGLHASLAACFRDVPLPATSGTAFVSIPREFESRVVSQADFERFRNEVIEVENASRRAEDERRQRRELGKSDAEPAPRTVPLGVFDDAPGRVGYAYAYALIERDDKGKTEIRTMMRTESFILVNGRVVLLMLVAPIDDGDMASNTFDMSEAWARTIIAENAPRAAAATLRLN